MRERRSSRDPRDRPQLSALRPLGPDAPSAEELERERRQWGDPKAPHVGGEPVEDQKLRRVTMSDRRKMLLAHSANRRRRQAFEMEQEAREGPQACKSCGREPCGILWPEGRCCARCSHEPMRHWVLTHVLCLRGKAFPVMEVTTEGVLPTVDPEEGDFPEGHPGRRQYEKKLRARMEMRDAIYYRWDGVVQWVRRARTHYFLGARVSVVEFLRRLPKPDEQARFSGEPLEEHPFESSMVERQRDEDETDREVETVDPSALDEDEE